MEGEESLIWKFFFNVITALYAAVLTIVALVFELSPTWKNDIWQAQIIFHFYMYSIGIIYLLYCYLFIINPEIINWICIRINRPMWSLPPTNYTGEGAGTMYLRLGALCFGTLAIVLYGMEIYLNFKEKENKNGFFISDHIVTIIFTFFQMHFIFCHSKIRLAGPSIVSKIGMMHLVSVNLWTWFRYVTEHEIVETHEKIKMKNNNASSSHESEELEHRSPVDIEWYYVTKAFGDLTSFFTTCIVEYSLIGAAVMFILWNSIDHLDELDQRMKRKGHMRIDCSRTSAGLFAGIIFVILAFVSIGICGIDTNLQKSQVEKTYEIVNIILFNTVLVASLFALYRIRLLQYRLRARGEIIDEILLVIGFCGELIYCFIGIDLYISSRKKHNPDYHSLLPVFVFVTRGIQVVVQTMLILTVSRLRCYSRFAIKVKPGKQILTFLLVANMSLFVFQTFENMKSNMGIDFSGEDIYATIVSVVSPLLVFYRFHSSVCLAEAWKNTYDAKISTKTKLVKKTSASTLMEETLE